MTEKEYFKYATNNIGDLLKDARHGAYNQAAKHIICEASVALMSVLVDFDFDRETKKKIYEAFSKKIHNISL